MERMFSRKPIHEEWMEKEGIPIYKALFGVEDITELPRRPWARMGGYGTFIDLEGIKRSGRGMLLYVAEIPAGGSLEPEKHLYNELIYILRGRGLSEVWHQGKPKRIFEWNKGSLFAIPLNAWHRLVNGGREPVLFVAKTTAAEVMEDFRNTEFIFNCNYNFTDRYTGQPDYFVAGEKRYKQGNQNYWETNFVPDLRTAFLEDAFDKVEGGQLTEIRMAAWGECHASEWPVGRYHKAHYHKPGPILLGLRSEGYVLIWPQKYGIHPYQDGHGDKVIKMDWKINSIYTPYSPLDLEVFHQHFNTGPEPARQLALRGGGPRFGREMIYDQRGFGTNRISVRNGGRLIEHEDEDPEIRRMFQEALRQKGIEFTMPPVVYQTEPFKFSL